jgi:RNA polymerase sigma factor (sigma-70 family)
LGPSYIDIHKALVDRCRKGDRKAQNELYHIYARPMYNVCMRIVNHVGEAEDILQESFIEAFRSIYDFRADSTFGAWLKKIVVNRSVNYLKKRKLKLLEDIPETADAVYEDKDRDPTQWEVQKVHKAIQELPDGYRLVLSLYLLEGYDHAEIAQILNISESTSKSQYNRAKAKVREQLMK